MAIARWVTGVVCFVVLLKVSRGRFGCESFVGNGNTNEYQCRVGDGKCDLEITQSYFKEILVYGWRKGCQLAITESVSNITITLYGDTTFTSLIR